MTGLFTDTTLAASQLNPAINGFTLNAQTGTTYTFVLLDAGKLVTASNASASAYTVPPNASVAFAVGDRLTILNLGAGVVTLTPGSGVTFAGSTLTVAQNAATTIIKTGTNTWSVCPFSSGSAYATVSGTTGSPTVTNPTGATAYSWGGNGTFVLATTGWVTVLVCGGGGGAATSTSGSGGGGGVRHGSFYLTAGTYTVTVGAGGGTSANGGLSEIASVLRAGGGQGGNNRTTSGFGGSGGEGAAGAALGGGAYAASAGVGSGVTSSIDGTSREYGMGGDNTGGVAPVYGSGGRYNTAGEAGATGRVVIRVEA